MASEVRLIDANALEQHCKNKKITELFPEWKKFPYAMKIALIRYGKEWKEIIQNAPTVDAVEMVHGRWVDDYDDPRFICEECGKWLLIDDGTAEMNYCPNCGADMRERKDND